MVATSEKAGDAAPAAANDVVVDCQIRELHYGTFKAVRDTHLPIRKGTVTALIGPSGC
jgi:phosphate transport system ATP-binding protein